MQRSVSNSPNRARLGGTPNVEGGVAPTRNPSLLLVTLGLVALVLLVVAPPHDVTNRAMPLQVGAPAPSAAPQEVSGVDETPQRVRAEVADVPEVARADYTAPVAPQIAPSIAVDVETRSGHSLNNVEVRLQARDKTNPELSGRTDANGEVRFVVAAGTYSVRAIPSSVPEGYQLPCLHESEAVRIRDPRHMCEEVTVESGVARHTLVVTRPPKLHGYVLANDGRPEPKTHVRARAVRTSHSLAKLDLSTITDEQGYYEIEAFPGDWVLNVLPPPRYYENSRRGADVPVPLPEIITLREEDVFLHNFEIAPRGGGEVAGRVLDQHSAGFPDLLVTMIPKDQEVNGAPIRFTLTDTVARTKTTADGQFLISGLSPGEYRLYVEPSGYTFQAEPGKNKLARHVEPTHLTVQRGSRTNLRAVLAFRSEPFIQEGCIADVQRGLVSRGNVQVKVVLPMTATRTAPRELIPEVNSKGEFRWWCEPPEDPCTVQVFLSGALAFETLVVPRPNQVDQLEIRL